MKKWIKEGDPVAHITNIHMKMVVDKLIYRSLNMSEEGEAKLIKCLRGVQCSWFEGEKLRRSVFHSRTLVPWDIALKGERVVTDFLNQKDEED